MLVESSASSESYSDISLTISRLVPNLAWLVLRAEITFPLPMTMSIEAADIQRLSD